MEPIELESSTGLVPVADVRPRMDELPPVRLVSVDDVRMPVLASQVVLLAGFYVDLWEFLPEPGGLAFRAENFRARFDVITTPPPAERDGVRVLGIEVASLAAAEKKLIEAEYPYDRQRGLVPGAYSLLMRDPAGNWIELFDRRQVA